MTELMEIAAKLPSPWLAWLKEKARLASKVSRKHPTPQAAAAPQPIAAQNTPQNTP